MWHKHFYHDIVLNQDVPDMVSYPVHVLEFGCADLWCLCWFCYIPTTLFLIAWASLSFLQSTISTLYSMVLLKLDVLVPYTCQNKSDTDNSWTLSKCWALLGYFPDVLNTSWTHARVFLIIFYLFYRFELYVWLWSRQGYTI